MGDEHRQLRERLLFQALPEEFTEVSGLVRRGLADDYAGASPARQGEIEELVAELAIDLGSYLPHWHLLKPQRHQRLDASAIRAEADRYREMLRRWGADRTLGDVDAELASIESSNLRRLSQSADAGQLNSRWGHDAASGLTWAIRRGAVLVTTNPVMVNTVRKEDPQAWDPVRDALKDEHPSATPEQRVSLMTMSVVLDECREFRPIWEATDGRYGNVSLQVNPRANDDAGQMVEEVTGLYDRLTIELGGPPNAMFKIPATRAGLDAVRRLTTAGIAVNVTANASVDQTLAFAEVIEQGTAPLSFITLMMGRLDDPVRDELIASGEPDAVEASRWASVAVLRRTYPLLFEERNYGRSAILAASMRGPWSIDGAIADGPSPVFITCFPDKAREYDTVERPTVSHIHEPLPPGIEEKLSRSQTFRHAYELGAMSVEDFDTFVPVSQTLKQFAGQYDEFVEYNR
jgi:transaldolase